MAAYVSRTRSGWVCGWVGGGILSESIANHAPAINPNDDHPMDATAIAINSKL